MKAIINKIKTRIKTIGQEKDYKAILIAYNANAHKLVRTF